MALIFKNGRYIVDYYPEGCHRRRKRLRILEFVKREKQVRDLKKNLQ